MSRISISLLNVIICIYMLIHMYIYIYIRHDIHSYIYTHAHTHTYIYVYKDKHRYMYTHMCIHIFTHVYIYPSLKRLRAAQKLCTLEEAFLQNVTDSMSHLDAWESLDCVILTSPMHHLCFTNHTSEHRRPGNRAHRGTRFIQMSRTQWVITISLYHVNVTNSMHRLINQFDWLDKQPNLWINPTNSTYHLIVTNYTSEHRRHRNRAHHTK